MNLGVNWTAYLSSMLSIVGQASRSLKTDFLRKLNEAAGK